MEVPTGTSFFILLYSAAYKNRFVGAGFHPACLLINNNPVGDGLPDVPVAQTIILSF